MGWSSHAPQEGTIAMLRPACYADACTVLRGDVEPPTRLRREGQMSHDRPVLLINPRMCSPTAIRLPLSLLHLAAVLEGRYDYRLIDGNVDPDATGTALAALAREPHALVC